MPTSLLVAQTAADAPTTQPAGKIVGWRGDGTGRYPNANPPLSWGRVARSVKELSAQALKPKDDASPARGAAIPDGVIRNWLVLGPLPLTEDKKVEDVLPNADALSPDADDKGGDLKWRAVSLETGCPDLCAALNIAPDQKGFAAYAHAYVYSPSGRAVAYNLLYQGQGINRVWLNGKAIYDAGKNVDIGPGARLVLPLQKGWNRLLVLNAKTMNTRKSWWTYGCLYGEKTDDYDAHGIVWATRTPEAGTSAPVIAGDRIFLTSEGGSVVCLGKADGKMLWVRSLSYYDFATAEERKAYPEIFAELDPLAEQVKKLDETDCVVPWKAPAAEKDRRAVIEGLIFKGMGKVSKDRYNNPATWGCEAGRTPCTPVTDGHRVYALFGTGIVACYDRDGNCLWKRLLKHTMVEHGYTTSPLLVDGKLVIYFDNFTVLDPKSGDVILERPHFVPGNKPAWDWFNHFHATACVLPVGKETILYYVNGEFVRLSDGKSLATPMATLKTLRPANYRKNGATRCVTPVVEGGTAYKITHNTGGVAAFRLPTLHGDEIEPEVVREVPFDTDRFPHYYQPIHTASPLLHEGLLYCVNDFGVLTVVDVVKGEVIYQRLLDLDVFMPYNGAGPLKGGVSSSPTLGGKYVYLWGNQGTCLVIEPGRTYKQVARNRLENFSPGWPPHQEATMTDPVFEGERMYFRGEYTLYCIGPK